MQKYSKSSAIKLACFVEMQHILCKDMLFICIFDHLCFKKMKFVINLCFFLYLCYSHHGGCENHIYNILVVNSYENRYYHCVARDDRGVRA